MLYNQANIDVAKVAAKEDARPEIASVFFTPDKTVATDSFKLIEVSVPKNAGDVAEYPAKSMRGFKPFLVDARTLGSVKIKGNKELPMLNNMTVKHVDKDKVELNVPTGGDGKSEAFTSVRTLGRVDGTFPDYGQVFPKEKPVLEITLIGAYLAQLCELLVKSNGKKSYMPNNKVVLKVWGELQPVQIDNTNPDQPARAMLMPIQK